MYLIHLKNLLKHIFSVVPMRTLSSFLTVTYFKLFNTFNCNIVKCIELCICAIEE